MPRPHFQIFKSLHFQIELSIDTGFINKALTKKCFIYHNDQRFEFFGWELGLKSFCHVISYSYRMLSTGFAFAVLII